MYFLRLLLYENTLLYSVLRLFLCNSYVLSPYFSIVYTNINIIFANRKNLLLKHQQNHNNKQKTR